MMILGNMTGDPLKALKFSFRYLTSIYNPTLSQIKNDVSGIWNSSNAYAH